jgi:hypothetical protein
MAFPPAHEFVDREPEVLLFEIVTWRHCCRMTPVSSAPIMAFGALRTQPAQSPQAPLGNNDATR